MIVLSSVTKRFGSRLVLDHVSLRIEPGEFVCVTGPSGAGKSTFIHMLIRAEVPTEGVVEVDGVDLAAVPPSILQMYRRRTGVVFQDTKLLSDRTVYENVAFAMEVCGDDDAVIAERVPILLRQVGLLDRASAFPRELSGGEKARAALARALVHSPMIVIADEPTGNVDPRQSLMIVDLLKAANAAGATVILASHDRQIVDALHVRVIRLEDGKVIRDSIGGYDAGTPSKTPVIDPRKHQIFESNAEKMSDGMKQNNPTENDAASGKSGKIKPIAI